MSEVTSSVGVMEIRNGAAPGEVIAGVHAVLDSADTNLHLATNTDLMRAASDALVAAGRAHAYAISLLAEVERRDAATHELGISTVGWLADNLRYSRREAHRLVHEAGHLTRFPHLADAAIAGEVRPEQMRAVTSVLTRLPDDLGHDAERAAEQTMVDYCAEFDSQALNRLSHHLLDVIAPEVADQATAKRLEREERTAHANRFLTFTPDGQGSLLLKGSLPETEGELLRTQVDAIAAQQRRLALDAADPLTNPTPRWGTSAHRADALIALARAAALHQDAPNHGGDRPRVIVTIDHRDLLAGCTKAGVQPTGTEISTGQLRRLACDAGILPIVLGGPSGVLDVGREHRLVTPTIRAALVARDQGCVFPGCDRPPAACEAHHLIPWQSGGATSIHNLALFCPHHHGIVEPGNGPPHFRWHARLRDDGIVEIIPPRHVDRNQRPRVHQRFRIHDRHDRTNLHVQDRPPDGDRRHTDY